MGELLAWSSSMSCTLVAEWLLLFHESCLAVELVTKNSLLMLLDQGKFAPLLGSRPLGASTLKTWLVITGPA